MGLSLGHLVIILIIVLVLFGAGKLPQIMSDMAKGMKAFKDGMKEADDTSSKSENNMITVKKNPSPTKSQSSKIVKAPTKKSNKVNNTKAKKSST